MAEKWVIANWRSRKGAEMGKTIYRIFLALLLALAAAGGAYYYYAYLKDDGMIEKGTFVNEMDYEEEEQWAA